MRRRNLTSIKVKAINNVITKLKNVNKLAKAIGLTWNDKEITSREKPTNNGNVTTDSLNKKTTARQNASKATTQNIQNSSDKSEIDTSDKRKLSVTLIRGYSMGIKSCKMSSRTHRLMVKHFSCAKTKDMKS